MKRLEYHLYSELAESKKEIDTLRADLNYFNATLSILKKYFLKKEGVWHPQTTQIHDKVIVATGIHIFSSIQVHTIHVQSCTHVCACTLTLTAEQSTCNTDALSTTEGRILSINIFKVCNSC